MAITAAAFEEMIKSLDKDGDGEVSMNEYEDVYRSMFPQVTHERFLAVWSKMDKNGDGNLTVQEVCARAHIWSFRLSNASHELPECRISRESLAQRLTFCVPVDFVDTAC